MTRISPLLSQHQQAEALLTPYGPAEANIPVVQTFGQVDLEYAALRKGCLLLDWPMRASLRVTGADRIDFLNRMLTQELKKWPEGAVRRAFWLSRKGRIDADLRLLNLPDAVVIDVDVHAAPRVLDGLSKYVITEDAAITDHTEELHRLALHGPRAAAALAHTSGNAAIASLEPGAIATVAIAGVTVIVDRADSAGVPGFDLLLHAEGVRRVYEQLLELAPANGHNGDQPAPAIGQPGAGFHRAMAADAFGLRAGGWAAYNIARIEAGTPVYFLDFGPNSLPAETGVLDQRVSFTKGCYLGQEIVARMHALGAPKQQVVALRLASPTPAPSTAQSATQDFEPPLVPQPVTGAAVFAAPPAVAPGVTQLRPSDLGDPIGTITSSAISPMLGGVAVCLATVKSNHAAPSTQLLIECEGTLLVATVQPRLRFWPTEATK